LIRISINTIRDILTNTDFFYRLQLLGRDRQVCGVPGRLEAVREEECDFSHDVIFPGPFPRAAIDDLVMIGTFEKVLIV
jgi:hypothetical protein